MTTQLSSIEAIVSNGLCAGCGLCASLVDESFEMKLTSAGRLRPVTTGPVSEDAMALVRDICPGVHVTSPDLSVAGSDGTNHEIWGPIRTIYRAWAGDPQIRFRAAAGGTLTAFGVHLLETGKVDAILHVRTSDDNPMLTDAQISTTRDEVIEGSQSRYGPAAPLIHVKRLLDEGKRFAVIAKPCDVGAIRNLQKIDARAKEQILYCLTNFCGGIASSNMPIDIAKYHGVEAENVDLFNFRGNGWPGPQRTQTKQGEIFDLTYDEAFDNPKFPWVYDDQFRCKMCADAIGEQADVSAPDGWIMKDGEPIYDEAPGVNVIVARTQRGEDLIKAVGASGEMVLAPFEIGELDAMHASHLPRKVEFPGRYLGARLAGAPATQFRNFRPWRAIARGGILRNLSAMFGTWKRIRRGSNHEPVA